MTAPATQDGKSAIGELKVHTCGCSTFTNAKGQATRYPCDAHRETITGPWR